jgi:hypothetical protein
MARYGGVATRAGLGLSGPAWLAMAAFWLGAQAEAASDDEAKIWPVEMVCDGVGVSRAAAIDHALANALARAGGADVAADQTPLDLDLPAGAVHRGSEAPGTVSSSAAGRVLRYRVLSVETVSGGGFLARVHAVLDIPRCEPGADSPKRIAIGGFDRPQHDSLNSGG